MTPRPRISATTTEMRVALRGNAHLQTALDEIARRTSLPPERVREHFDGALLATLDVVGLEYVADFEAAVANVRRLRERVHEHYQRLFEGKLTEADAHDLIQLAEALEADRTALADPQRWARDQPARPVEPARTIENTPAQLAVRHRHSRVLALTEERRTAYELARRHRPDLVEAALRGDARATANLRRALAADRMNDWAIDRALEAVADIREPGVDYAFGAGISGLRTGPVEVRAAFRDLPPAQRDVLNQALLADPDFVRAAVITEEPGGAAARGRLARFCDAHGITGERRAALEAGLNTLNDAHLESQHTIRPGEAGSLQARTRARALDRAAAAIGLPSRSDVANRLGRSSAVVEMATRAPGHLAQLADNWLSYAVRQRREGKPVATLERYARALSRTHVRGMLGELTAVFQLAGDAWVIKVPGQDVTLGGTDFVLVVKNTGEMWYGDNKALSSHGLGEVSSLVDNIVDNMAADQFEFGNLLNRQDTPLPPKIQDAITRAGQASSLVSAFAGGMADDVLMTDRVQSRITDILDEHGVRRIVTNSGGELGWLTRSLRRYLDFVDLDERGPYQPERVIDWSGSPGTTGGTEGSTP